MRNNQNQRQIRLTEQDLHFIVENAVMNVLMENREDELFGGLGALFGGAKNKLGDMANKAGNAMGNMANKAGNAMNNMANKAGNMGRNMANAYNAGNQNAKVQKMAQKAIQALTQLQQVAVQLNPGLAKSAKMCIASINKATAASQQNMQTAQNNMFSTQAQA